MPLKTNYNPPGLSGISRRIGNHPVFFENMLMRLSKEIIVCEDGKMLCPLANMRTEDRDEPGAAIMDAWATALDVLTFYQERIANEGYLKTALERRSVISLARSVGYEFSPGVSASAFLEFTVDDAPGSPQKVIIPPGAQVMSVSQQNDAGPLIFETEREITARVKWNNIKPAEATPLPDGIALTPAPDISGDAVQVVDGGSADDAESASSGRASIRLQGVNTSLQKGDIILVRSARQKSRYIAIVRESATDYKKNYTVVSWSAPSGVEPVLSDPQILAFRKITSLFGQNAPDWNELTNIKKLGHMLEADVKSVILDNGILFAELSDGRIFTSASGPVWKEKTNLPSSEQESAASPSGQDADAVEKLLARRVVEEWTNYKLDSKEFIDLDSDYPDIMDDSWAVLMGKERKFSLVRIKRAFTVFRRDFGISGKVTRLAINPAPVFNPDEFSLRDTTLFVVNERLEPQLSRPSLAEDAARKKESTAKLTRASLNKLEDDKNIEDKSIVSKLAKLKDLHFRSETELKEAVLPILEGKPESEKNLLVTSILKNAEKGVIRLVLGTEDPGLTPGQFLSITGKNAKGEKFGEIVVIAEVLKKNNRIIIELKNPLKNDYMHETVNLNANVVRASHGETIENEILGSGDPIIANQRFILARKPLTYSKDGKSSLKIRVNGVLWREVSCLNDFDENSRVYTVRHDSSGNVSIIFGDGKNGARLPGGTENVIAKYRIGLGAADMPGMGELFMLSSPPMGIRAALNPVPAEGGQGPETHEHARVQLPFLVSPNDRIVSVKDYENFASTFPGVAFAYAARLTPQNRAMVHITLAGEGGATVPETSSIIINLYKAIKEREIFGIKTLLQSYEPVYFGVEVDIFYDPDYLADDVEKNAQTALLTAFSFEKQEFGGNLTESDIIPVLQNVLGVTYLNFKGFVINGEKNIFSLSAQKPGWNKDKMAPDPVQMLLMDRGKSKIVLNMKKA